jgi:hypothetical protein
MVGLKARGRVSAASWEAYTADTRRHAKLAKQADAPIGCGQQQTNSRMKLSPFLSLYEGDDYI